jgi:hypothetical protein
MGDWVDFREPDLPLVADLIELVSLLSLLAPSRPANTEAEALGLSLPSPELLILLLIEDRIDREELSLVSDLDMDGYCWRPSGTRF